MCRSVELSSLNVYVPGIKTRPGTSRGRSIVMSVFLSQASAASLGAAANNSVAHGKAILDNTFDMRLPPFVRVVRLTLHLKCRGRAKMESIQNEANSRVKALNFSRNGEMALWPRTTTHAN